MGLDMYLHAQNYMSDYNEGDKKVAKSIARKFPCMSKFRAKSVKFELAYWRKANAIHGWFVKNVQNDNDDCGEYEVSEEQLRQLLSDIDAVLLDKNKAKTVLPPTPGCFFGSYETDDYYFGDLKYTKKVLKQILGNKDILNNWYISYRSSW